MDTGAWLPTVYGVSMSRTQLSKHARTHAHTHPLVIQWLGLHAFMPWTQVQSLIGDLRPCKMLGVVKK